MSAWDLPGEEPVPASRRCRQRAQSYAGAAAFNGLSVCRLSCDLGNRTVPPVVPQRHAPAAERPRAFNRI